MNHTQTKKVAMTNQPAKEQTRKILVYLYDWGRQDALEGHTDHTDDHVDQALSQIEEIVMGVIGKHEDMRTSMELRIEKMIRNEFRDEQLKRWSGTIKP